MTALLIKKGLVVDGTGAPGRTSDVRIRDGLIAEIGSDLAAQGERVIDAGGAVVAPGFIDSHTHFDATVYWDPRLDPMAQHGVTTVVAGNCSLGLAPMRPEDRVGQIDCFSYIEDMPADLLDAVIPWDWENYPDYARSFDRRPLGVNMTTFAGHSQIRAYVMGDAAWERAATPEERAQIVAQLEEALKAGANGLSFSLFDKDRRGRMVPSRHADDAELDALIAKLADYGAVLQFIPGHTTEDIIADLQRVGGFLARHEVPGLYNALVHLDSEPDRSHRTIACIEQLRETGAYVWAMVSPRPFELRVDFEQSICFINVPAWNELVQAPAKQKRAFVHDPAWRERARRDVDNQNSQMFPFHIPQQIRIIAVGKPELANWVGKSLGDLVAARGGHISDVLADWAIENDFDTAFVNPVANSNPSDVARLLKSPVTFISGGDAGAHLQMFCGAGEGTLVLTRYVRERGDLSLEEAIHALTGQQAELLGMTDRGTLAPGKAADITIFNLDELTYVAEKLVDDLPGGRSRFTRDPGGFRYTIVNGVVVQENGRATEDLPGSWVGVPRAAKLAIA
jgi:N-acyl-D-aspartate/D-glutamate deacylase